MREKLKNLRMSYNYTQQELADKVEIHRSTYTNIEKGKKNPSLAVAKRIKDVLNHKEDDTFLDNMFLK